MAPEAPQGAEQQPLEPKQQPAQRKYTPSRAARARDALCAYLLSLQFVSSAQTAASGPPALCSPLLHTKLLVSNGAARAGVLVACLFLFVREWRFPNADLLGVGVIIALLRVSAGVTAGGRARGAAMLVMSCWGLVLAGVVASPCLLLSLAFCLQSAVRLLVNT